MDQFAYVPDCTSTYQHNLHLNCPTPQWKNGSACKSSFVLFPDTILPGDFNPYAAEPQRTNHAMAGVPTRDFRNEDGLLWQNFVQKAGKTWEKSRSKQLCPNIREMRL